MGNLGGQRGVARGLSGGERAGDWGLVGGGGGWHAKAEGGGVVQPTLLHQPPGNVDLSRFPWTPPLVVLQRCDVMTE